jgi:purine-nucleoside/S-methyl-5'-thioadenosine phosphorylase / adenosine deaminase
LIEQQRVTRYLQFSHLSQFSELAHGIFTRHGGHSQGYYEGLNTSTTLKTATENGDKIANVIRNRQLALSSLGIADYPAVSVWQVHGADVATVTKQDGWRTDWSRDSYYFRSWEPAAVRKADALITQEQEIALALSFADCTPILFYDPVEQVIGIAHGGWRGTARGIVMATIDALQERFGCQPRNIYAGIAPAIGPCCYEVSSMVRDIFMGRQEFDERPIAERYRDRVCQSAQFTTVRMADGRESLRLDVQGTNRGQLLLSGILPEHIETLEICTSCQKEDFFSHRGHAGKTGRFPVVIALRSRDRVQL